MVSDRIPGQALRRLAIVGAATATALCCYAAGACSSRRGERVGGVLSVQELRLVNESGSIGARLGFDGNGHSSFEMYDENRAVRLSLSVGGRLDRDRYLPASVSVFDRKGREISKLRCYSDPGSASDYGGVDIYHDGVPVVLLGRDLGMHSRFSSMQLSDDAGRVAARVMCGHDGLVSALQLTAHPIASDQGPHAPSALATLMAKSQSEIEGSGAVFTLWGPAESASARIEAGDGAHIELFQRGRENWRASTK